jgi:diadenosine tetraphosphatase ApaH/serine/threonine PP2A family protein phosphatase
MQCLRIFGDNDGRGVWDATNDFFDTLPLAARVGGRVFCVHGGLPRELCQVLYPSPSTFKHRTPHPKP